MDIYMSQLIQGKIQKWGNGLALRVSGLMRDIPQFEKDTLVNVEVFEDGFTVKKANPTEKRFTFPLKEAELLQELTPYNVHADELAVIADIEMGNE
jgi:antitoxin MazE